MFIQTPKDILYIVLALALVWIAVFLCWALYYVARILRNANEMVEEVRERATRVEEAVRMIREKMDHFAGSFAFVAEGVMRLVNYVVDKRSGGHRADAPSREEEMPVEIAVEKKKKK